MMPATDERPIFADATGDTTLALTATLPPTASMPATEPRPTPSVSEQHGPTGVVFVHGIGSQTQSATVREFAAPLLEYLRQWHRTRGRPDWEPDAAELSYGGTLAGPARVLLHWPSHTAGDRHWPERRFIFAEAWWATRLQAPSLDVMVLWSLGMVWDVITKIWTQMLQRIGYLTRQHPPQPSDPGALAAIGEILSAIAYMIVYLIAALLGYVVLIPLFILAHIPIDEVQQFVLVKVLKPFLVEQVGDHETYMNDEMQALNIRAALGDVIRDLLTRGCDQVVVIAHSQGALVAFDALCALGRHDPPTATHVRKFITLGGALNRAFAAKDRPPRLLATLPAHIFWLDIWSQYDPVAGGYLRRPHAQHPLANPSAQLRRKMGWDAKFDGPQPDQVTNSMNPLVDHGGYFQNPEQVSNRLLAELDDPADYYKHSRFFFEGDFERVRRRRTRISALAWWRLIAIAGLIAALILRGVSRLMSDGHGLAQQLALVPGHELLTAPGAFFDGLGVVLDKLGSAISAAGILSGAIASVRSWWVQFNWGDLLLASLVFAAVFALLHFVLSWTLYRPWDERERQEAVAVALPRAGGRAALIALRALGVLAVVADAVAAIALP